MATDAPDSAAPDGDTPKKTGWVKPALVPYSERVAKQRARGHEALAKDIARLPRKAFKKAELYLSRAEREAASQELAASRARYETKCEARERAEEQAFAEAKQRAQWIGFVGAMLQQPIRPQDEPVIAELMRVIHGLRGNKVVTVSVDRSPLEFDVSADGKVGYAEQHAALLRAMFAQALAGSGSVVVRQFLPVRVEREQPNGKFVWIPEKAVCGAFIGNGRVYGLPASKIKAASTTNAATGTPLAPVPSVHYIDWPGGVTPTDRVGTTVEGSRGN